MSAHTPGPWRAQPESNNYQVRVYEGPCSRCVADVWGDCDELAYHVHANASLIAAAPDLLAALKALVEDGRCSTYPADDGLLAVADAAIAKAEGR
jgi:hypothetical protein